MANFAVYRPGYIPGHPTSGHQVDWYSAAPLQQVEEWSRKEVGVQIIKFGFPTLESAMNWLRQQGLKEQ